MESDKKKSIQAKKLSESKYDKNVPVEFVENDDSRPATTPDVDDRHEDIQKLKGGDVGAEQYRLNDDGTPKDDSEN